MFNVTNYTNSIQTLILDELRRRGYTNTNINDSRGALRSVIEYITANITRESRIELYICKVERVRPYNLFSDAVKGLVRCKVTPVDV